MELILKFEEGGEPRKKIQRGETQYVYLDLFLNDFAYNKDKWVKSANYKRDKKALGFNDDEFELAYERLYDGYKNGNIVYDPKGKSYYYDNEPEGISKNAMKAAHNYLNEIMRSQDAVDSKDSGKSKSKIAWNPELGISVALAKRLFNGQETFNDKFLLVDNDYNSETGKRGIAKRWAQINPHLDTILDDYEFENESDRTNALAAILALRNAYNDDGQFTENEEIYINNIFGNNPTSAKWFYTGEKYEDAEKTEADRISDELEEINRQRALREGRRQLDRENYYDQLAEMLYDDTLFIDWSTIGDYRFKETFLDPNEEGIDEKEKRRREEIKKDIYDKRKNLGIDFAEYASGNDLFSNNPFSFASYNVIDSNGNRVNHISGNGFDGLSDDLKLSALKKAAALDWLDWINSDETELGNRKITSSEGNKFNGWYIVNPSHNNDGLVTIMDKNANSIRRVPVRMIFSTKNYQNYMDEYVNYNYNARNIPVQKRKEGGVLKMQFGGAYEKVSDQEFAQRQKDFDAWATQWDSDLLKSRAEKNGRTVDLQKASERKTGDITELTDVEWARIGAIGADLTSAVAAWVPGAGTVVSAGASLAGLGANMYADIRDDSVSGWEVIKNAGINLGLGVLGLVPGLGTATKFGKIAKSLRPFVNTIIAASTAGYLTLNDELHKSFAKLKNDEDLTVEDWKNIAMGVAAFAGLNRLGASSLKTNSIKNQAKKTTSQGEITVKTKNGKPQKIEKDVAEKLKLADSPEKANTILKENGIDAEVATHKRFGFWGKDKINRNIIKEEKGITTYDLSELDGGRWGSLSNRWSDLSFANRRLNPTFNPEWSWNPYNWGLKKGITVTPNNTAVTTKGPVGNGPTNRQIAAYSTVARAKASGAPGDYGIQVLTPGVKTRNINGVVWTGTPVNDPINGYGYLWTSPSGSQLFIAGVMKQGGKFDLLRKYKQGGLVLKAQEGIQVPTWFINRYSNHNSLLNWRPEYGTDFRLGSGIEGFRGDAGSLNTVYSSNNAYTANKANITSDILNYYNTLGGNLSAEDFVKLYNESAAKIRGTFDRDNYYRTENGINATDATAHNKLFKEMFNSRSLAKGDSTGANLGYDENMEGTFGSSTWHRRMDLYENEFDGTDVTRIHEITGPNGQKFKVYKKANGDIGLITSTDVPEQPEADQTPLPDDRNPNGEYTGFNSEDTDEEKNELFDPNKYNNWRLQMLQKYPWLLSTGRLLGTLATNKDIYNTMSNLKTYYTNAPEVHTPIRGDLALKNDFYRKALDLRQAIRNSPTADASLNLAANLDYNKKARDYEIQGDLADNQEQRHTKELDLQDTKTNIIKAVDNSNQNKARGSEHANKLLQLLADYKLKNWNAIGNYLIESLQRAEKDYEDTRAFAMENISTIAKDQMDNDPQMKEYYKSVQQWVRNNRGKSIYDAPDYDNFVKARSNAYKNYVNTMNIFGGGFYNWRPLLFNINNDYEFGFEHSPS